jgi:hypothetical protein
MQQQSLFEAPAPSLTRAEADRRKAILGLLQDGLAARQIVSALAGRRTLVLRSAQGGPDGYVVPERPADPRLYVFTAGDVHIVTTDGEVYRFTGGHTHPATDPGGAALACARWMAQAR